MEGKELETEVIKDPAKIAKIILKSSEKNNLISQLWYILEETDNKRLTKSCKKVMYILKSNGVDVDDLKPEVRRIDEDNFNKTLYKAFLYIPDSFGNSRLLISIYNRQQANYEIFDIIYNMDEGIKQIQSQKASKRMIEKISENENELVEIPVNFALRRLKDVAEYLNNYNKIPEDILYYLKDIGAELHPVLSIYQVSISGIFSTEKEKELFSRPEIARLMIPDKYTKGYKDEIMKAQNSILIVNNMTPQERIDKTINRFIRHYFTHLRLGMYRSLLLDIALYFHRLRETELAKLLVNYAEDLIRPITDINSHPLVQLLIYKSFFIN